MMHSICILPSLAFDSQKLAVILRAQNWEICRSLMVVFNWCRDEGPTTAKHLLDVYCTKGYDGLKKESPHLAEFVNHIVWYVYSEKMELIGIGIMGLIVREALTADHGLSTTNESFQRVLQGKHSTRSSLSSHNPDHTNPIWQYSFGAKLLYCHQPSNKLTTKVGLS
jgi:hypothetical protein